MYIISNKNVFSEECRIHKCGTCGRRYKNLGDLKHHMRKECSRTPSEQCPLCPYATHRRYNLKLHLKRIHKFSIIAKKDNY